MKNHKLYNYWGIIVRPHLRAFLLLLFLSVAAAFFGMATLGLGIPLIDAVMQEGTANPNKIVVFLLGVFEFFGFPATRTSVVLSLFLLICLVAILHSTLSFFQQYWSSWLSQRIRADIKIQLFEKVLRATFPYLESRDRGALLYDINRPSESVYRMIDFFGRLINPLMHIVLYTGLLFYLSWNATLALGVVGVLWIWKFRFFMGERAARYGSEIYEVGRMMEKTDVDSIDGIHIVKSHQMESRLVVLQKELLRREWKPKLRLALLSRGVVLLTEGMAVLAVVVLGILALGLRWIDMSLSGLIVFVFTLRRMSPAFGAFSSMNVQLNQERKNIEVIEDILERVPQEPKRESGLERIEKIKFLDVGFSYPSKRESFSLGNITMELRRGETTAIVGSSGSGKSTLAKLLLQFYQPQNGMIVVNEGADLKAIGLCGWRSRIGYVSQEVFLFNDTLRNNIALWKETSREEVEAVARLAQIHDFILSLPDGYDTIVGDRGLKLSGGQAQRVAIAREILKNPEVFIFDEATSALDNLTEKAVYEAIATLHDRAVVLVIAHRLSTIQSADQIVVLRNGRIEEQGRHESLLKEKGLYAELYNAPIEAAEAAHA